MEEITCLILTCPMSLTNKRRILKFKLRESSKPLWS